jgi:hypothetical protein
MVYAWTFPKIYDNIQITHLRTVFHDKHLRSLIRELQCVQWTHEATLRGLQ